MFLRSMRSSISKEQQFAAPEKSTPPRPPGNFFALPRSIPGVSMSASGLHGLWLRWKSLRLPWRRHILVGSDLAGNTFWEYLPAGVSRAARPRRILRPSRRTHHGDVQVSPQWHQWLKQTRPDAPSMQEQVQDLGRIQALQTNARLADARWEAKARYIEKPEARDAEFSPQRKTTGSAEEVKQDRPTDQDGEKPRGYPEKSEGVRTAVDMQVPNDTPDPWKTTDEKGQDLGQQWQPKEWSPRRGKA